MTTTDGELSTRLRWLWEADDDAEAVQFGGVWVRWRVLRSLADGIGQALDALGLGAGARVGAVLTNSPESVAVVLAVLGSGRCLTVFNPLQPAERLRGDVERAAPPVLVVPAAAWDDSDLAEVADRLGTGVVTVSVENAVTVDAGAGNDQADLGSVRIPSSGRRGAAASAVATAPGVAVELTTSGTTGPPKRIPLTYRQLEASVSSAKGHMKPEQRERRPFEGGVAIVMTPIVHIGGLWAVLQALVDARPIVLLERFHLPTWVDLIREHRPRLASLPPAAIRNLLAADVPDADLASLRAVMSGTAPVPAELVDEMLDRYGIRVLTVYGATEFSGAVVGWSLPEHREWWARKRGSVGRPFPGVEVRVVDVEDGAELPAGASGLLEVKTVQAGAGASADGWIRTSDLARVDSEGFVYIEGRADDVIVRGGFKIRPATVVAALESHPAVAEAAVLGLPDARLGQVPAAVVELVPGAAAVGSDELRAWCRPRLLPYEVPAEVRTVAELPRGVSQKVSMPDLVALFETGPADE